MKPGSKSSKGPVPIEDLPIEWDFRWVASDEEAEEVYLLELTREVIREADSRLKVKKEGVALRLLLETMANSAVWLSSPGVKPAIEGLQNAGFVAGVVAMYGNINGRVAVPLPTALEHIDRVREIVDQRSKPHGVVTGFPPGKSFNPHLNLSGGKQYILTIQRGMTARAAKQSFEAWADANLPAGQVLSGGRPDEPVVKLLRLAYYRFDRLFAHPRPFGAFAVAVRKYSTSEMAFLFSPYGNLVYAPFMNESLKQPRASSWSEYVTAAKAELEPLVLELVKAARLLAKFG